MFNFNLIVILTNQRGSEWIISHLILRDGSLQWLPHKTCLGIIISIFGGGSLLTLHTPHTLKREMYGILQPKRQIVS